MDLRFRPRDLVAELREKAREIADDMNEGMPAAALKIGIPVALPEHTIEGEAADTIDEMLDAFGRIYRGEGDPEEIAWTIIDPNRTMEA